MAKVKTFDGDVFDLAQALEESCNGEWFEVVFRKRTDGSVRRMQCRTGVKKHLAGGKPAYDFKAHGLLPVWIPEQCRRNDNRDTGYRTVPVDSIIELHAAGRKFVIGEHGKVYEV